MEVCLGTARVVDDWVCEFCALRAKYHRQRCRDPVWGLHVWTELDHFRQGKDPKNTMRKPSSLINSTAQTCGWSIMAPCKVLSESSSGTGNELLPLVKGTRSLKLLSMRCRFLVTRIPFAFSKTLKRRFFESGQARWWFENAFSSSKVLLQIQVRRFMLDGFGDKEPGK